MMLTNAQVTDEIVQLRNSLETQLQKVTADLTEEALATYVKAAVQAKYLDMVMRIEEDSKKRR